MRKRVLSSILAIAMLLSLLPTTVFAAGSSVAEVNGQEYSSLTTALSQAPEDGTVKLLANVTWKNAADIFGSYAKTIDNLTLDLNGNTLIAKKGIIVKDAGNTLTITDSAGTGKIVSKGSRMFTVKNAALDLMAGTYDIGSGSFTNYAENPDVDVYGGSFTKDVSGYLNQSALPYTVFANQLHSYYATWKEAYAAYRTAAQVDSNAKIASTGFIGRDKVLVTLNYGYNGEQDTYATTVGSTIVLPALQRDGYQHTGWTFEGSSYATGAEVLLTVDSPKTFVAQWSSGDRTVTYLDAVTGAENSVAVMNGSQIVLKNTQGTDSEIPIQADYTLEDPARDGYTFLGWVHTIDTNNSNRHTFTARWAQNVNLGEVAYDAVTDKSARLNTQDSSGIYTSASKTYSYFTVEKDSDSYFTVAPKANLAAGKTYTETIYLTKKDDNSFVAAYQVSVTVTSATATPSFAHNGKYAVTVGESKETKLDNLPAGATVTYASSNNGIVRVSENGTITGVSVGTATITATITAENYTEMIATCTVTVSPQQFTIVIDPQNGDAAVTRPETVSAGEKVPEPAGGPYTKAGCEFLGWSLNKNATTEKEVWNFDHPVTAEADWDQDGIITFYAVYAPVYYTVTFNLDGGQWNGAETQQVQKDAQIQKPVDPTKEGYTFRGWAYAYESGASGASWDFDNTEWYVTGDLTLTAKWEPIDCTVTFNANGGAFTDQATTHVRNDVDYGTALDPVSDKPEQDGYTFLGWSTNANATEADWVFDTGVSSTVTPTPVKEENLTLYAVWQIQNRTIVYQNEDGEKATATVDYGTTITIDPNGGEYDDNNSFTSYGPKTDSFDITVGANITLANPTRDGYTFTGWEYNAENHRFAAQWEEIQYTVTLDANGGKIYGNDTLTRERSYSGTLGPVPVNEMQRDGYTFLGWAFDQEAEQAVYGADVQMTFQELFSEDYTKDQIELTLYAVWEPVDCSVTFHLNGGATPDGDTEDKTYRGNDVVYGETVGPQEATKTGYTLEGWYTDPAFAEGTKWDFDENVILGEQHLYAKWVPNTYSIVYHFNVANADVADVSVPVTYGATYSVWSGDAFQEVNPHYTFLGWAVSKTDQVNDTYAPGATNSYGVAEDFHLYAVWTPKTYTFRLDANGGTVYGMEVLTKEKQCTDTLGPVNDQMEYDGHTFLGWAANKDAGAEDVLYGPIEKMQCSELASKGYFTLYAVWDVDQLTVSYSDNGGEDRDATATVDYGTEITIDPNGGEYDDTGSYKDQTDAFTYTVEANITLANPTRDGYTFTGWVYNADSHRFAAKWEEIQYTVTLDANGGKIYGNDTLTRERSYNGTLGPVPVNELQRNGYTFQGWAFQQSASEAFYGPAVKMTYAEIFSQLSDKTRTSVTLYAVWTPNTYTLTYNANGGTFNGKETEIRQDSVGVFFDQKFSVEKTADAYKGLAREGYTFLGWALNAASEEPVYRPGDMIHYTWQQDITLYAVWSQNMYTVTFNANGGTFAEGANTAIPVPENGVIGNGNAPEVSREGYNFGGWSTAPADGDVWSLSQGKVTGDRTLYAIWTLKEYTFTYPAYNNSDSPNPGSWTFPHGTVVNVDLDGGYYYGHDDHYNFVIDGSLDKLSLDDTATKEGYTFVGWKYEEKGGANTFTAMWAQNRITITFHGNRGTTDVDNGSKDLATQTMAQGVYAQLAENPFTRTGYTFAGWNTKADGTGTAYGDKVSVNFTTNVDLYAMWTANQYTITYNKHREGKDALVAETGLLSHGTKVILDLAGGTLEDWGTQFTLDQNLTLPDPRKSGCIFDGWLFNGESNTFTAQWKAITYTVTFDANGGEGTMTTQTFQAGVPEALNENTFTRTNYHFVGWSENADAAQADIQDGQIFTFADQDSSRTLYAIWALDTYDFTYYKHNADDRGNAIDTTIQVTHGSQYYVDPNGGTYYGQSNKYSATVTEVVGTRTLDNTATRPGYTFDGWQYYENGNTYVAQWKANPYTVTFMNEGATYYTMTVNGGEGIHSDLIPVNPTLAGKTFLGWYLDGATTPYDFNTPVTGDITLYAVWEDVEYTVTFIGNGGSNEYGDQNYPVTVPYNKALDLTKVPAFTRQGYVFLGWSTQCNHAVDYAASVTTLQVNGDMTLYAVWAQVVDFGTIPYGTGEQHVKTIDYQNGIVNVTNQGDFNAVLDGNDNSRLMISPAKDMAPSNEVYSTIMRVDFEKNNMTQYVQAMVKISQQEMEISTNMSEVDYYTVGDSFTVYVTAAPDQNLTLDVGNAAGALQCTQELQEVAGTPGTYTAVYEVVSIPSDAQNLKFTVMDAFGNTADYQETINLRTEVIVTVSNVDGTQVSIPTMYLGTDEDSGNSKQLPLTWNEDLGKYTALADKASGWDYVYFQTADGREVFLRNTTVASESITEGIQANDGLVEVEYTFGGYTIAGNLYINDVAVPNVSLRISGNYGDAVDLQQLINQAWQPIVDRYPNAKTDKFDISVLLNGSPVQIKTFGETNYDWGSDNTIYVNVYATAGYHVDYDLNWQNDSSDVVYTEFVKHGETATGYANPSREGFKFAGWYVDPDCTTAYDFTQPVTNNMILYAKWEANVYLVQFNNGYGGIYEEGTPWAPQEIPYNGILSKPTEVPTRPGYTFNGWYLDPEGTKGCFNGNGHCVVTTDMVIYAGWKQNDYWLVYHNVEDASNANQFQSYEIHYGDVIQEPEDPIWEGYTFQGWYLDETYTEPATFPITVGEKQVDLYAKWAEDCQVAFFYYHYAQGDGEPANVVTVPYGGTVEDPGAPPAVSGYIFDGWYTNTDWTQKWDFNTPVTQTMHLYAKWVEAVTVTFNLNGGASTDDADGDGTFTLEIAKGSALPDTLATPTHPTFVFGAWYADADQFSDPWNMEAPITESMTLTAGWEKATGVGKFFNTTQTSTYVMIRVQDANGNWQPATGIEDLTLSAENQNGLIFNNVHMQEILPESPNWQSDWDPDYAYYTASFASTPLTGSGQFSLIAAGYDFTVSV